MSAAPGLGNANLRLTGDDGAPLPPDITVELAPESADVPDFDTKGNILKITHGDGSVSVSLDGKPLSTRHSVGMAATTAVGSLAATDGQISKAFVEALWNTPVPSGEQRYFDGMLYLMSMMHASGEFRIIDSR